MLIEDFLTYLRCERNLSVHTVVSYGTDLREWAHYATGGHPETLRPLDVTTSDLRTWISSLSAAGMSARTIHRKASALCSFYRYLIKRHNLSHNPAADLVLAKVPKPLPTVIPRAQTNAVIDSVYDTERYNSVRDHLIVNLLYQTGIRVSEVATLLDANVSDTGACIKVRGKRDKERVIPIGDELVAEIRAYRQMRDRYCTKKHDDSVNYAKHNNPSQRFFVKSDGSGMVVANYYRIVRNMLDGRVTATKRSPHVLRHSFATDMLNNGADLNTVKALLGHQSLETTQIYTHISMSELKHNYELAHPRAQKKGGHHGSKNPSNPL